MKFCGVIKVLGNAKFTDSSIVVENQRTSLFLYLWQLLLSISNLCLLPTPSKEHLITLKILKTITICFQSIRRIFHPFNRVEFTLEGGYDELPTDKRIKNMNKKEMIIRLLRFFSNMAGI